MGRSSIQGPVDSTGKRILTRKRTEAIDAGSVEVHEQIVIPVSERVATFRGMAHTFRIPGTLATGQTLAYFRNATGSAVLVAVHDLHVDFDATAATATIQTYKVFRVTASLPTGGTAATKVGYDSTQSSAAQVSLTGAASADGTASAITYTAPATTPMLQQFAQKFATYVGVTDSSEQQLVPRGQGPLILRPGEDLVVHLVGTANNVASNHYAVGVGWEEYTVP